MGSEVCGHHCQPFMGLWTTAAGVPWLESPGLTTCLAELSAPDSPFALPSASWVVVGLLLTLSELQVLNL